jgi:hypothetical protein
MTEGRLAKLRGLGSGRLGFLLKVGVAGAILAALVHSFDSAEVKRLLLRTDPWAVAGAVTLLTVQSLVMAKRWSMIMRALGAVRPLADMVRILFVSLWFNQALPSSVGGDAVRVWMLHRLGIGWRLGGKGVLIDRLTALLAVVLMIAVGFPFLAARTDDPMALVTVGGLALAATGGTVALVTTAYLPARWLENFVLARIASLGQGIRYFLTSYERRAQVMALAILIHALTAAAVYVLAGAIDSHLSLGEALLLTPPVILLSAIPITIGSWGVREGAMVAALAIAGVPAEAALVTSILLGLSSAAVGLMGGVVWLTSRDRRAFAETRALSSAEASETRSGQAISMGKRGL